MNGSQKLLIIGLGKMGGSLLKGLISEKSPNLEISVVEPDANHINIDFISNNIDHYLSIDKINSFFGYKYISNVTLKTVRDKVVENRKSFPKLKNINKIEEKINKVNDNQLKGSLNSLLKAYNERNR